MLLMILLEHFMKKKLQKTNEEGFRLEKVIKIKGNNENNICQMERI